MRQTQKGREEEGEHMLLQRQCSIHLHDMRFSHVEEKRKTLVFELLIGKENTGTIEPVYGRKRT